MTSHQRTDFRRVDKNTKVDRWYISPALRLSTCQSLELLVDFNSMLLPSKSHKLPLDFTALYKFIIHVFRQWIPSLRGANRARRDAVGTLYKKVMSRDIVSVVTGHVWSSQKMPWTTAFSATLRCKYTAEMTKVSRQLRTWRPQINCLELEGTLRVRTHVVVNPNPNVDLWPFNPTLHNLQWHSLYQVWTLWDHLFLCCGQTNKQTNRQTNGLTRKSYPRRPTYSAW